MSSVNKVFLLGNVTRDLEIKYLPSGAAVCDIGVACNRKWKDRDGNMKEDVTFVDVTCFGKTAEIAGEYLQKGRQVHIEGRLQLEQWEDRQSGQKRSKLKVVCDSLTLLSGGQNTSGGVRRDTSSSQDNYYADTGQEDFPDDSVPF